MAFDSREKGDLAPARKRGGRKVQVTISLPSEIVTKLDEELKNRYHGSIKRSNLIELYLKKAMLGEKTISVVTP